MQFGYTYLSRGRCYSVFSQNSRGSSASDSTACNHTKLCVQYTYFCTIFVTIFPKFLGKSIFCILLKEMSKSVYVRCTLL